MLSILIARALVVHALVVHAMAVHALAVAVAFLVRVALTVRLA